MATPLLLRTGYHTDFKPNYSNNIQVKREGMPLRIYIGVLSEMCLYSTVRYGASISSSPKNKIDRNQEYG